MTAFTSILVANRGEIAVRIMRTAQELGYRTIAVYSEADATAPHVAMADDAVFIGPAPAAQSYLDMERILAAAKSTRAEAIHPGYGFLSENAAFAQASEDANLVFIGPTPEAIALMGNKAAAKRRMIAAGVPCVPGYEGEDQTDAVFIDAATTIGFPLMVKAAAGGGGRGMRLVEDVAALPDALAAARSEAANAFGSDELILEKAIIKPRHVEIQVLADMEGHTIHLGERDCSVQRRHQKVVEESPCPVMTDDLRARMGQAAVDAARNIGYRGAGTVEFLLDADGAFYFLEMNTRLQVEHPVTELVTGLDLVALQISVAEGQPLGLSQGDVSLSGHAIEVRLYAEDPAQDFLPCTGQVTDWKPADGPGVRIDSGIESGQEISPFYDPMIAKIIAWGNNRDQARERLNDALRRTRLFGLTTNRRFLIDVLDNPAFAAGEATTAFIGEEFSAQNLAPASIGPHEAAVAAVLLFLNDRAAALNHAVMVSPELLNWSSGVTLATRYTYTLDGQSTEVAVTPTGDETYDVSVGDTVMTGRVHDVADGQARLSIAGHRFEVQFNLPGPGLIDMAIDGRAISMRDAAAFSGSTGGVSDGQIVAPMHGTVLEVLVEDGEMVAAGTRLAVLEAMKMQHDIVSPVDGIVETVSAKAGTQIAAAAAMFEIKVTEP